MKECSLKFRFKENRSYITGTDIFNAVVCELSKLVNPNEVYLFHLEFHRLASRQCRLIYGEAEENISKPGSSFAKFQLETPHKQILGYITESGDEITERYKYEEDLIISLCTIEGNKISINALSPYSTVEVLVAMTKELHYHIFPPKNERWIFTRLQLNRLLSKHDANKLTVLLLKDFNGIFTKSSIHVNDELIGNIYFSLLSNLS